MISVSSAAGHTSPRGRNPTPAAATDRLMSTHKHKHTQVHTCMYSSSVAGQDSPGPFSSQLTYCLTLRSPQHCSSLPISSTQQLVQPDRHQRSHLHAPWSCWHHGLTDHLTNSLTQVLALRLPYTHIHTEWGVPHPGEDLEMEFNEKTGENTLIGCQEWPDKHTD